MDAAGIEWTIVSGFRDDWRQSIASGIKARTGYSRHGGSRAVGGYGHGRAVDVGHVDREKNGDVFRWIDENGARYGLHRPIRHFDPPHVEPRGDWRRIAARLKPAPAHRCHRTSPRQSARGRQTTAAPSEKPAVRVAQVRELDAASATDASRFTPPPPAR